MALNILKLCVGVSEIAELAAWQDEQLSRTKRIYHVTRMMPRRAAEIAGKGSIYWVIRGMIMVRQKIIAIEPFTDTDGIERCKLVFDAELVPVRPVPRRAFQGWRYLEGTDAPPDLRRRPGDEALSDKMAAELAELGLI